MNEFKNVDVDALADALLGNKPESEEELKEMQKAVDTFKKNYEDEHNKKGDR